MKTIFRSAWPYADDALNLPVKNVEEAIPFYETVMGFKLVSQNDSPCKSAVLARDDIQIGLAENGGDPEQEGCFFEVDNAEAAFAELKEKGLTKQPVWVERKPPRNEKKPASGSINTEPLRSRCSL
jgi:catechol 2,3-dioxygenase-like lactoylglutathione lyase family enzyme